MCVCGRPLPGLFTIQKWALLRMSKVLKRALQPYPILLWLFPRKSVCVCVCVCVPYPALQPYPIAYSPIQSPIQFSCGSFQKSPTALNKRESWALSNSLVNLWALSNSLVALLRTLEILSFTRKLDRAERALWTLIKALYKLIRALYTFIRALY